MVSYRKPKIIPKVEIKPKSTEPLKNRVLKAVNTYFDETHPRLKFIDCYILTVMLLGVVNFVYCVLFMPRPFNIFLSSFISCLGSFVLGDESSATSFSEISHRKALLDFFFAHIILHAVVINYMG